MILNQDNLSRWFVNNTDDGNRSNQLIKYAYALVDSGKTVNEVQDMVLLLNDKLTSPLPQLEIMKTIMISVANKINKKED